MELDENEGQILLSFFTATERKSRGVEESPTGPAVIPVASQCRSRQSRPFMSVIRERSWALFRIKLQWLCSRLRSAMLGKQGRRQP